MAICCPKTFTGFCLDDNTPIAITIDNGVLISWTNLITGVVTPGNPPAGTGICEVPSTITVDIEPLTCIKDAVTVCQGTSPWVVSGTVSVTEPVTVDGTVALDAATLAALETITVNQGTSPWVVTGSFTSNPLTCEIDSITVCPPVSGVFDVNVVSPTGGATEETLLDVKRSITDFRTLLDYDIRVDGNPVYVGKNLQTALTSSGDWVIQKLFYDISNRLIDAQVLTGSWDGRAALAWKPAGGN